MRPLHHRKTPTTASLRMVIRIHSTPHRPNATIICCAFRIANCTMKSFGQFKQLAHECETRWSSEQIYGSCVCVCVAFESQLTNSFDSTVVSCVSLSLSLSVSRLVPVIYSIRDTIRTPAAVAMRRNSRHRLRTPPQATIATTTTTIAMRMPPLHQSSSPPPPQIQSQSVHQNKNVNPRLQ